MSIIIGTEARDLLKGTAGSDYIVGGAGNDVITAYGPPIGTGFYDRVRAEIADGPDIIFGGRGNDSIRAGGGSDFVDGGRGNDTISGGAGADVLLGGPGHDVFQFSLLVPSPGGVLPDTLPDAGRRDVILDFHQGVDLIDLRGWENVFHPGATFTGQDEIGFDPALQVGFRFEGDNTIVELSRAFFEPMPGQVVDYFGPAGEIELVGHVCLTADDFLL
jgi:hypothetical protein